MVKLFRRPTFGDEVSTVQDGAIRLRGGAPRVIVGTSSLNFGGMAPEQQSRTIQAFRDLLHAQSGPMQLYLRVRRIPAADSAEPQPADFRDPRAYLAALTRSFINTHLQDTPVYQREVFVVLGPTEPARQFLRSWLFRFDRTSEQARFVATDFGTPLRNRAQALAESLRRIGVKGRVLDDQSLSTLLAQLYGDAHADEGDPGVRHRAYADRADNVEVGGRYYTSFVINRYPGEELEPGWLLPLLSFKGELHAGIHILPLETDRMLTLLHHRIRDLRANDLANLESGTVDQTAIGTLPDALTVHQALARNEEKAFAVSFYLTIGAENPVALHAEGHYWGYNKETGGLCVFDPFDAERFSNANIAVLAHSGAGKSYAAASVVLSGHTRGIGAIVIDPEAEYGGMIRSLGGTYLHLAAGSGHAINALDPLLFAVESDEPTDQLSDVLDLIGLMCGRLDEVERAHVEVITRSVIANAHTTPVLGDIWRQLDSAQPGSRVSTILRRWVTGDLGRLFSAPTNVDLGADIVGFNLRDLSEELIPPSCLLLANWLWTALRRDRRPRHLLIDEVGLLLEHEPIRRFLIRLARRIRKYGGSLILVSQNPGDFFETKDGAVLATNPSILLLGSQKHSEAMKLQKAFNLTERQVNYLETAERGDFLLVAGPNRVPVHVMVPPWMDELIVKSRGH